MIFSHKVLILVLVCILALALVAAGGCSPTEPDLPVDDPDDPVDDPDDPGKTGTVQFDHDFDLPDFVLAPDYLEDTAGLTSQVVASTGPMFITLTPDGEFLNLLSDDVYGDFPIPSPDGTRYVVYGDPEDWIVPWNYIYLGNLVTAELEEITYGPDVTYEYPATWSHDGSKIIFTGIEDEDEWIVNIYYIDFDARESGIFLDVTELGFYEDAVESCTMHPTENILYIIGWQEDADWYGVYAYDLDAETLDLITLFEDENYVYHVAVSPRDNLLAVTAGEGISEDEIMTFGLYLIDSATGDKELLFWEDGLQAIFSSFSLDGSTLLVCTDTRVIENTWSIYRYDVDARAGEVWTRAVYDTGFEPFSPSWTVIVN